MLAPAYDAVTAASERSLRYEGWRVVFALFVFALGE